MRRLGLIALALFPALASAQDAPPYTAALNVFVAGSTRPFDSVGVTSAFRAGLETDGIVRVVTDSVRLRVFANVRITRFGRQIVVDVFDVARRRSMQRAIYRLAEDSLSAGLQAAGLETSRRIARAMTVANSDSAWRRTASLHERMIVPIGGLHLGRPARYSLALGAVYGWPDAMNGPFAVVEGGRNAGRLSLGYMRLPGNLATGLSARASFLRIYRDRPPANYAGAEVQTILLGFGWRFGVFRPLRGSSATLYASDFSWML